MKAFTYEQADQVFKSIGGDWVNQDQYGFSREIEFTAEGVTYKVIWFKNQSTLIIGGLQVMFFDVEVANTWPSPAGAKMKLQFRDADGNCVAVIVLERY